LRAGKLRHIVTVEHKGTTKGSMGEIIETWTTFATIWAKIIPGKGREAEESRREVGIVPTRFYTRYSAGVTQGMRLKYGSRLYDIVHVANIEERNREFEITAVETI